MIFLTGFTPRFHPFLPLLLALLMPASWAQPGASTDYLALGRQIAEQAARVDDLSAGNDRVDHRLLEPLLGLASVQTRANRFDDADASLEHAIQVVRVRDGLFTPAQYAILEQSVENNIQRGAWDALTGQLDHLQWLFGSHYQGEVADQLERLMWLSDKYLQGVFFDREERQVQHLKHATRINRLAYELASQTAQVSLESRIAIGYALARKYHLEAQGIRGGDETGFAIRSQLPDSSLVDSRKRALRKRYHAGLDVLRQLDQLVGQARPDDIEAQALLDLALADWQLLFNKSGAAEEYPRIYRQLVAAGVDRRKLDAFFSGPVPLPEQSLALDINRALTDRQSDGDGVLRVFERSENFPGIVLTSPADLHPAGGSNGFAAAGVEATLDPFASASAWIGGTLRTNRGTLSDIRLTAAPDHLIAAGQVRRGLHELHWRPALAAGELQVTRLTIQYAVRRNRVVDEFSIWDALQVGQR